MPTKAETYLQTDVKQKRVHDEIKEEVYKILRNYPFKKILRVGHSGVGELFVEVQEDFPSQLINDLDEYMGFPCTVQKTEFAIRFTYKLPEELWV